jgi:beta-barrel assembly-enhancing protease
MPRRPIAFVGLLILFATVRCAPPQRSAPKPGFNMFTKQQDIQLGREAASQVRQHYYAVQNTSLQEYLKKMGERLAATAEASGSGFPFTFTLLNEKSVNAFALPGGPMFVFTGLVTSADNEAQLAGVMAHEMSHVILRHGTNQASKANLLRIPAILAATIAGNGSLLGQLAQLGIGLGFNSVLLKFSRTDETQADALGSRLMSEAGYNPMEMARFFEKLSQGGARVPQFLSDHPNPGNRQKAIEGEIRALPKRTYTYDTGEFPRTKKLVAELSSAPTVKGGLSDATIPPSEGPSGDWLQFRGQHFNVSYPGNWKAFGDNTSQSITIAPREGVVQNQNGGAEIGYGVILSYYAPDTERQGDLKGATDDLVHHLRLENQGMQKAGEARSVRVDGADGLVTMLENASPYGGAETDALLTVIRPEGLFYMVFIAPQKNFAGLQSAFDQMVNSIRFTR